MNRALALFLCLGGIALHAQSVAPPVVEYPSATEGSFEISNPSLTTLYAAVEPKSFTIDADGTAHFSALSPDIHVDLSTTSMRIPPHQSRTVYYKASATAYPAWFCIYSELAARPEAGKVNVALELPHTVYLLGKGHAAKQDIAASELHVSGGTLTGVIENHSAFVVRVQDLHAGARRASDNGFPLLPGGRRRFSIDLGQEHPATLSAKLASFEVKFPVP